MFAGLPSILDPPSAPTDPQPPATQAGQLLHSFNLLEPSHDESLSPKTAPDLSSAPAVLEASQVPAAEGHSGSVQLPHESASGMLPIPLLEHTSDKFLPYHQSSAAQNSSHAQTSLSPAPAVHTTTAAAPAAASDHASGIWQAEESLSAVPEMQPVKPAAPLLVKSASSVSQQSILSYGQCIRELQLKKLGEGKPVADPAAAEDQPVTLISSSQGTQSEDSMGNQQAVAERPQQSATATATASGAVPQLWLPPIGMPSDQTDVIDDAPQLSVSAVLQRLRSAAPALSQSQEPPLADVAEPPLPEATALPRPPQLAAMATAMPPGSPTGALLPGTGSDLLQRPGSSPLPVSKMLRMVSEEQGTLLSDLAAQCAAPGGLLGTASQGQLGTVSSALSSPAQSEPSSHSPAQFASTSGRAQQAQHAQHGQGSMPMSPVPEEATTQTAVDSTADGADTSQQASAGMSASISADQAHTEAPVQMKRSPLRKRLSQIFSPVLGSSSSAASDANQQQQQQQQQLPIAQRKASSQDQQPAQQVQETAHTLSQLAKEQTGTEAQTQQAQQAQQHTAADAEPSGHVAQLDCMEDAQHSMPMSQHSMPAHTASMSPRALRSPSPPFRPLSLLSGGRSSASLHGKATAALHLSFGCLAQLWVPLLNKADANLIRCGP